MKSGVRAVGIAESYRGGSNSATESNSAGDPAKSTLAGVVTRADRVVDGCCLGSCTVGGTDATAAVISLIERLDRPDVRYVFLGAIAPAWYNLLDLPTIAAATDRPVICVTFEQSTGLEGSLRAAFSGEELDARLGIYRAQPPRQELSLHGERVFVRSAGFETGDTSEEAFAAVARVVRAFTPEGGRPEPLRVARTVARGADAWRADW